MVEMIKVESSNVVSIGWDNNKLYVEYKSGTYEYDKVDRNVYLEILGAKSRGRKMHELVKGRYSYRRI